MPNIKSAIKRVDVSAKQNASNVAIKSDYKTAIKKAKAAIEAKDASADELVKEAVKKLDMAASKKVLPKNTAARKKSKLTKALNASK